LVKYQPKHKADIRRNLITGESEAVIENNINQSEVPYIQYWNSNITLQLVEDFTSYSTNNIPPPIRDYIVIDPASNKYFPVLFHNEFWVLREHFKPITPENQTLSLIMDYGPTSLMKWTLLLQLDTSLKFQGEDAQHQEEIKKMLLDTNPYLLGLTFAVSMLHMVFDFLAFKNDITFWKNTKTVEGLSVRTITANVVMQGIIFLYLLDNTTTWMITLSAAIGLAIECWKLTKAAIVTIDRTGLFPKISIKDRDSYASKTKEFDDYAMKYLGYLLYVLVFFYAIYSLVYETHKSWYSFVLSTLVGTVYTFGFIMMTPQLFINYKLKSVAHLPWKVFMYKALNTFIDDLFAFIIQMPLLHRLSCFRDDIIFFIYLYQRWIYPVDKARVNEFGASGNDYDGAATQSNQNSNQNEITKPATAEISSTSTNKKQIKND